MPKNIQKFAYLVWLAIAVHLASHAFAASGTAAGDSTLTQNTQDKSLQVTNIRVGMKGDATRIVLDLNMPTQFTIEQSMAGDKLVIKSQDPIDWNGPSSSAESKGVIQNFKVVGSGAGSYLEVQTEAGTAVKSSVIQDPDSNTPKYIVDLLPNIGGGNINKMFSDVALINVPVAPPVTSIDFEVKHDDTFIKIRLPKAVDISVIDNIYTNQVIISLPKVDWRNVRVPLGPKGLITEYKVDQSLPDKTNLILSIDKAAGVIGKRLLVDPPPQQSASFMVVLSTDNAKVPAWLSEVTVENLPYTAQEKTERMLETRALQYRGGAAEYASIGEGFYLTALGGQIAGTNTTSSNHHNFTTNLSPSLMGASAYFGLGYGVKVERFYAGLEGLYGYQSLFSNSKYVGPSGMTKLNNTMGFNWLVAGRAGYYTSPVSLLYGKVGVASARLTLDGNGPDSAILYNSKKQIQRSGFLFGLGVEAAVDDQFSARIETYQTTYQPFKSLSAGGSSKFHPRIQEMLVGISWKPSPMSGPMATDAYEDSITSGVYIGGEAGLGSMVNDRTVTGTPPNKYKASSITMEPLWGMYGGYAYNIGRYYVAGEGQIGVNQSNITESRTNSAGHTESLDNFLRWSLALTGRFGYVFNHGVIGYGRVGMVAGRFGHDGKNNTGSDIITVQKRASKTLVGLRIGGGLEIFLKPSLSLRGDYNMDLYPRVTLQGSDKSSEKVLATRNEFRLGLAYTFPVK